MLNSANVSNVVQVSSSNPGVPVDFMVKQSGGATYIFAAAMRSNSTTATFSLTGIPGGKATVVGEARQIAVSNGNSRTAFPVMGCIFTRSARQRQIRRRGLHPYRG